MKTKNYMRMKRHYQTPGVLRKVTVLLEGDLLAASIVDESLEIISDGQEVVDIDASSSEFGWNNHWEWETGGSGSGN